MKIFVLLLSLYSVLSYAQNDKPACKGVEPAYVDRMPGYYVSDCKESEFNEETFIYYPEPSSKAVVLTKGGKYRQIFYWKQPAESRKMSSAQIIQNYYNAVMKIKGKALAHDKTVLTFSLQGKEVFLKLNTGSSSDSQNFNIVIVEVESMKQDISINLQEAIDTDGKAALYGILFDVGKSDIKAESTKAITQIIDYLKANPNVKIIVVGHTDNAGTFSGNVTLSKARAQSIRAYLIEQGKIAADRLLSEGVGQSCPVTSNETEEGRKLNRRVEIVKQ